METLFAKLLCCLADVDPCSSLREVAMFAIQGRSKANFLLSQLRTYKPQIPLMCELLKGIFYM